MYSIYAGSTLVYSPAYVSQGYAVTSPSWTRELNMAATLEFRMPASNPGAAAVSPMGSVITMYKGGQLVFRGRCTAMDCDIDNIFNVYCESDLAFLNDSVVVPYTYNGTLAGLFSQLVTRHNARVGAEKQFAVGTCSVKGGTPVVPSWTTRILRKGSRGSAVRMLQKYLVRLGYTLPHYGVDGIFGSETQGRVKAFQSGHNLTANGIVTAEVQAAILYAINGTTEPEDVIKVVSNDGLNTLDEITEKLLEVYGGFLSVRYEKVNGAWVSYLDLLDAGEAIAEQTINFGVNLISLTQKIDAKDVYTVVVPLGKQVDNPQDGHWQNLTVSSVNGGSVYVENADAVALFGKIERVVDYPDIDSAATLLSTAKMELGSAVEEALTMDLTAVDMTELGVDCDALEIGYYTGIISAPHDIELYLQLSRVKISLDEPGSGDYSFGNLPKTLTDEQRETARRRRQTIIVTEGEAE